MPCTSRRLSNKVAIRSGRTMTAWQRPPLEIFNSSFHYDALFTRGNIEEILNLQPLDSQVKAYQVRQVRGVILKYQLGESDVG
jgi:hypothetical protein